jgi:hypothetical protein
LSLSGEFVGLLDGAGHGLRLIQARVSEGRAWTK